MARPRSRSPDRDNLLSFLDLSGLSTGSIITLVCAALTLVFMLQGWLFSFDDPLDGNSGTSFVAATRRRLREELNSEDVFKPEDWGSFHERHAAEIRELERSFKQLQNADHRKLSEEEMAAMQLAGEIVFPGGASLGEEETPGGGKTRVRTHADEVLTKLREEEEAKNEELTKKAEKLIVLKQMQKNLKKTVGAKGKGAGSDKKQRVERKEKKKSSKERPEQGEGLKEKEVQVQDLIQSKKVTSESKLLDDRPRKVASGEKGQSEDATLSGNGKSIESGAKSGSKTVQAKQRPKVIILTANEARPCKLARGYEIIMKGVKNKIDYAR